MKKIMISKKMEKQIADVEKELGIKKETLTDWVKKYQNAGFFDGLEILRTFNFKMLNDPEGKTGFLRYGEDGYEVFVKCANGDVYEVNNADYFDFKGLLGLLCDFINSIRNNWYK